MRHLLTALAIGSLAVGLTACGDGRITGAATAAAPASTGSMAATTSPARPSAAASPSASVPVSPLPFASPEAAMRYLSAAYNRNDEADLRQVTTPLARQALDDMRSEAVNLRLTSCAKRPVGDYLCSFTHDYPASLPLIRRDGTTGHAQFVVGPATNPGWYMTVLENCG